MFLKFLLLLTFSLGALGRSVKTGGHYSGGIFTCTDHFGDDYCQYNLHWAALSGDVNGTLAAIHRGKNINEQIPGYGTPLHQAAFYGRSDVVKILLQYGANFNLIDQDGDTPIAATDMKWCFTRPNDKTCQMDVSDYRETIHLLTIGCTATGCGDHLHCTKQMCVNYCGGIQCGLNAVCDVHNHRAVCRCKRETYHGDPAVLCLEMGEAKYIYRAFCFVKDVVTTISSAIVKDIKILMKIS